MATQWKYEIGENLLNEFRDLIILKREIRKTYNTDNKGNEHYTTRQHYYYYCNKCGQFGWFRYHSDETRDFHMCNRYKGHYDVGDTIIDDKRDLIITDQKIDMSGETNLIIDKYKCNKCGWEEGWGRDHNLFKGNGCACCAGKVLVPGINDIATIYPDKIHFFANVEDVYNHTKGSHDIVMAKCPSCGETREMRVFDIIRLKHFPCPKCGDGFSYPEKVMYSLLSQIGVDFITQLSRKNFEWCDKYKYDFYLKEANSIIEIHGEQHYRENQFPGRSYEKVHKNDILKKELALSNGIDNYIVIDARKSNIDFIKKSIQESNLLKLVDVNINNINWEECEKFALNSFMVEVCKYWSDHTELSTEELGKIFKIDRHTALSYLEKGTNIGICNYNKKEWKTKNATRCGKMNGKEVNIYDKDGNCLGTFESCSELARQSEKLFGVKMKADKIIAVCNSAQHTHKGYTFKYTNKSN